MPRRLILIIRSDLDENKFEMLKNKVKNVLEEEGIEAEIEDFATKNITFTSKKVFEELDKPR